MSEPSGFFSAFWRGVRRVVGGADTEPDRAAGPYRFIELGTRGRVVRIGVIAFLVVHITSLLIGGAIEPIRKVFTPVVGWYADALRMTNSWGMFGKPPTSTNVVIEAVDMTGKVTELASTDPQGHSIASRIIDGRMRKFLGRLADPGDMARIGGAFFDYYCREGKRLLGPIREVRVRNVLHETRDDDGAVTRTASSAVVGNRRCDGAMPRGPVPILPVRPAAPRKPEADL